MEVNQNKLKVSVHIPLYIDKSKKFKKKQFSKVVKEFLKISENTKIHVHTNKKKIFFIKSKKVKLIYHNLKDINPLKLTWMCRNLMETQKKKFDVFIYSEDDIFFTKKNFIYWNKFKDLCIKNNYNLGFIRAEKKSKNKALYASDVTRKLISYIFLNNIKFAVNDVNPYCAFWIYDKHEFNKFILTKYWKFKWNGFSLFAQYYTREMSAIGWHGKNMNRYISSIIPIKYNKLNTGSYVFHLSNKFANNPVLNKLDKSKKEQFGSLKIVNLLSRKLILFKEINIFKKKIMEIKYFIYKNIRFNKKNFFK